MIQQLDETSVVLVGRWNPAIFTADWLNEHIFPAEKDFKCEVYYPISDTSLPLKISLEHIELFVSAGHLVAKPKESGRVGFKHCFEVAGLIADKLRYTPFLALGINIGVIDEKSVDSAEQLFEFNDAKYVSAEDYLLESTKVTRSYEMPKEKFTLNYTVKYGANDISVKLNFDKQSNSFDELIKHLNSENSDAWYDKAFEFLGPIFGDIVCNVEDA